MAVSKASSKKNPFSRWLALWLYRHGAEDLDWGTANGQLTLQLALLEMSSQLTDKRVQATVRTALKGAIAETARAIK